MSADTVPGVAARAGVDPDGLAATVAAYNAARQRWSQFPAGKPGPWSPLQISRRIR